MNFRSKKEQTVTLENHEKENCELHERSAESSSTVQKEKQQKTFVPKNFEVAQHDPKFEAWNVHHCLLKVVMTAKEQEDPAC